MMSELERLDEALSNFWWGWADDERTIRRIEGPDVHLFWLAAKRYRDLLANGQRVEAKTLLQSGWFAQVPESGEYIVIPALSVYPKEAENE